MHLQVESPGVTLQAQTMLLPAHISSAPLLEVPPARQYDKGPHRAYQEATEDHHMAVDSSAPAALRPCFSWLLTCFGWPKGTTTSQAVTNTASQPSAIFNSHLQTGENTSQLPVLASRKDGMGRMQSDAVKRLEEMQRDRRELQLHIQHLTAQLQQGHQQHIRHGKAAGSLQESALIGIGRTPYVTPLTTMAQEPASMIDRQDSATQEGAAIVAACGTPIEARTGHALFEQVCAKGYRRPIVAAHMTVPWDGEINGPAPTSPFGDMSNDSVPEHVACSEPDTVHQKRHTTPTTDPAPAVVAPAVCVSGAGSGKSSTDYWPYPETLPQSPFAAYECTQGRPIIEPSCMHTEHMNHFNPPPPHQE